MSFGENKGLWLGLAAAVVVIAALVWLLASGGPMTLVILFPDAGELERKDPVMWHGYNVGRVESIEPLVDNQVGVTIRLNEDYAAKITRGTRFTMRRASILGLVGTNAIEVETPERPGEPFTRGERVQGISTPRPTLVEQGKQWTAEYWKRIQEQAQILMDEYNRSPYKRELEDAFRELKTLADAGARQAKEGLEQFRKDHQKELDAVVRKLEQARDWMIKKGDEAGARRLEQEIEKLKK